MQIVFIFTFWYILLNFFHSGQWYPKYATSVSCVHSSYFNHLTILSLLVIFQILVACLHQQFYPSVMFDIQESLLCKVKTLPQPSPLKPWVIFHYQSAYSLFLMKFYMSLPQCINYYFMIIPKYMTNISFKENIYFDL